MEAHRQDAQVDRLLGWLEQADQSAGSRKPAPAVGRDGLMLPIRGQACYREGATATVSVHDRKGGGWARSTWGGCPSPARGLCPGN